MIKLLASLKLHEISLKRYHNSRLHNRASSAAISGIRRGNSTGARVLVSLSMLDLGQILIGERENVFNTAR